jgi:glycosyltransferase involved in cell wall biosynthesis
MTLLMSPPAIGAKAQTPLKGRDIVCFSHDWTGDPLSRNHLMRALARENRILWVNSIGCRTPTFSRADLGRAFKKLLAATRPLSEVEPNIFVFNPLAIPLHGRPLIGALNRWLLRLQLHRAMQRLNFRRPISWISNPAAAILAGAINEEQLIYHCVDENTAFSGVDARSLGELEHRLLQRADLVVVTADLLYQSKVQVNPRTVLVRHGVDHVHFCKALDPKTAVPPEITSLPRPILGFFGLIADWVDLDLLAHVARTFSSGSLVMLGKATTDVSALAKIPNVHLLGRKPYQDLPAYCKGFDVALMPFRINKLTLNANPLKVREYLAAGLPVVSTPLPEVEVLGQCRLAGDPASFVAEIRAALADPGVTAERSEAIRSESWEARMEEIRGHLAELADQPRAARGKEAGR